jgi:DNA-binding transcriptional LysR family regulator
MSFIDDPHILFSYAKSISELSNRVKYIIIMLYISKSYGILTSKGSMNLNQLRIFHESAKCLSYSRAAENLSISQPAVSSQIKQLEILLRAKLFNKVGRRMQLTEPGKLLLVYAQKIFDLEHQAESALKTMKIPKKEAFHVGTTRTYARYLMPNYISAFHALYPGVSVSLSEGSSKEMIQSLFQRKNELAIVANTNYPKTMHTIVFRKEEVLLISSADYPLNEKETVTLEELSKIPLIMPEEGSGTRKLIADMFKNRGYTPAILYEASNLECIKELLIRGEGLSFMVRPVVEKELSQGILKEIKIEGVKLAMDANIVYIRDKTLSTSALAFLDILCGKISPQANPTLNH